ncbi:L,D-transpeptidase [Verrucomicrobiaceae bacterium N1E253]|uniref:L,D-transpeptidase n=1 Tax=Oceaniferula marina TaxID=2748318 RepID=A0A851G9Y1_9BACT|nr:L,D-transpeptidase family protein [Oceaniferula marina]NWK54226.1 L,D-transpeptidase [Oceaniferula marina]
MACLILTACSYGDPKNRVIVSVKDQKMLLVQGSEPVKTYPISTSKFGLGDRRGSHCTPVGRMEVAKKIGRGAPSGAVFKSRKRTGEVLKPNAPGRDPIVSRIIWLNGKQRSTRNAYGRFIYIHGTPEERTIGNPRSYGCIRMKSKDVIDLYRYLGVGSTVDVIRGPLVHTPAGQVYYSPDEALQPVAGN